MKYNAMIVMTIMTVMH